MNSSISILIVEDEMLIAAEISMDLEELGYEVKGIVSRGEQALIQCREDPPDILLLDINLKGEMDGIQLAQNLQEHQKIPIIFLTANTDDATFERAKEVRPYAFLDKPYAAKDLRRTLELVVNQIKPPKENTSSLTKEEPYKLTDRIFVRHKDQMVKVAIEDILFIKADGNYSLVTTHERSYLLTIPIKILHQNLPDAHFMRVHRSYIVNMDKIEALTDNRDTIISGKHNIPISRNFKSEVMNRLRLL